MDNQDITEEEFLATYNPGAWPRPSLTADTCVFRPGVREGSWQLLLVERGGHPYRGCWALPGGFSNPGEEIEQTAARELCEEAGLGDVFIERTYTYSGPGRDPRGWVATQAFVCIVDANQTVQAGDDAARAVFFDIEACLESEQLHLVLSHSGQQLDVSCGVQAQPYSQVRRAVNAQGSGLAFDHARLIADAYLYLLDSCLDA